MTSNCSKCSMPLSGASACKFCGTAAQSVSPPSVPSALGGLTNLANSGYPSPMVGSAASFGASGTANSASQLRSLAYEVVLMTVTLGIGGLIWSWVVAFSGQTPAGKLRDELMVNVRSGKRAPAWKLIIRQTLLFAALAWLILGAIIGYGVLVDVGGYWIATLVIPLVLAAVMVLDVALIFTPMRRRLIDWVLAIKIADGNGYSFRNFKAPGA